MTAYSIDRRHRLARVLASRRVALPLVAGAIIATVGGASLGSYFIHPLALPLGVFAVGFAIVAFRRPAWGVALALLAIPLELVSLPTGSGAVSPTEGMLALISLAWLGRMLLRPSRAVAPSVGDLPIIIFLATVGAGMAVAVEPAPVARVFVIWSLFFIASLAARAFTADESRLVIAAFLIGAGVLGIMGTADFLASGDTVVTEGGEVSGSRAVGTFTDPNYAAALILLGVLPGLGLILSDLRRFAWLALPALAALGGIVFSLSRGGVLGLVAGVLVLLLAWSRGRRAAYVSAAIIVVALLLGLGSLADTGPSKVVAERLSSIVGGSQGEHDTRPVIWRRAADVAVEHPVLGVGVNQFQNQAAQRGLFERGTVLENAHSIPLGLAAETGLVGLAAFIAFVAVLFARGIRAVAVARGRDRGVPLGLVAALLAFCVQGLTLQQVRVPVVTGAFFVLAGLLSRRPARLIVLTRPDARRSATQ